MSAHIVHVVHRFDTGGLENGMINLFNTLAPARYRHSVIALTDFTEFRRRITAQPVEFHALQRAPGHGLGWTLRLRKLLRRLQPDLVHTRNLAALEAQFVAAAAGVCATVHGEHGRDVFDLYGQNWKYNVLRRTAKPFVSNYIAVSRDLETWLRLAIRVPPRKIHQIYNGVDSDRFRPREGMRPDVLPPGFAGPQTVVFGSVGRMAEVKDYPMLVRAFIRLVQQQPALAARARLVIVGEGPARSACQALLDEAGLAHLVWLPGERHDVDAIMQAFDVFALPSKNEGISNTILEALASGLPVIATAVGGNVELVEDGVNGTLVRPGDAAGMAQALLAYLDAPARIAEHGRLARLHAVQRFSIPVMAEAYAAVYDQTLKGRQAALKTQQE
ncbi:MAG: TIGR03088 family PEP-CTERM/XrtA system glycosyltransferase [Thiobacillus sp.]|uniref:TIGR03088 family PEP-CTERM/XrtA system glycosyltransferase n=1 Tax=Thiobacillus sp. TaxID=924 RepID=UPI0028952CF8|nr:TIGR03088 family PEP-CTERM/XrtA system glycosyltransferase [Thiobacillus sp.]MDT3706870.1 TIGR03088 family PEP-CTERM/XrtA system glycosyltransferase [Thiobacillus sp.]